MGENNGKTLFVFAAAPSPHISKLGEALLSRRLPLTPHFNVGQHLALYVLCFGSHLLPSAQPCNGGCMGERKPQEEGEQKIRGGEGGMHTPSGKETKTNAFGCLHMALGTDQRLCGNFDF